MPFHFSPTAIPDVIVIKPPVFPRSEFAARGISETFVQCNHSKSARGILRGLHYQKPPKAQGKLVRVLSGEIYDVAVDLRRGGPTYGKWIGVVLSSENANCLYVPAGFAHGFCVVSEQAETFYMATEEYAPSLEAGILWNDPDLNIVWPIDEPRLSNRDRSWPRLKDAEQNFSYRVG